MWKLQKYILILMNKGILNFLNDKLYIKLRYFILNKKNINLNNPITFNEKMQWLKLNDRNDLYTTMVDKFEVKKYVSKRICNEIVIPTLAIYNKVEDIDFEKLPDKFVIKCTHNSGDIIICKNKENLDINNVKKIIKKSLNNNYFYHGREWPYKNVKPRILIEEYIEDDLIDDLRDYKFMCFNGEPKFVYVTVKNDSIWENYYDIKFKPININHGFPRYKTEFPKPEKFDEMISIARKLSENIPFLRVDLHYANHKILFGEMTFYDWGGFKKFKDSNIDNLLGSFIDLSKVSKL